MRGYAFIGAAGCETPATVAYWVDRAAVNIQALISKPSRSVKRG